MDTIPESLKSSIENPLTFFYTFFEITYIDFLRKQFMPDTEDQKQDGSLMDVDWQKEEYTKIHSVAVSGHEEDRFGQPEWITDETEIVEETYSFEAHINTLLKKEHYKSIDFINLSLDRSPTIEKSKQQCQFWIDSLLFWRQKCTGASFCRYKECAKPLELIIKYLLEKYPSICPVVKKNSELEKIRAEHLEYEPQEYKNTLNRTIFKALTEFEFKGEFLFEYTSYSDQSEKAKIARSLEYIAKGKPCEANVDVRFKSENVYIPNYILRKIKKYYPKMKFPDGNESEEKDNKGKKIIINGNPVTSGSHRTAKSRDKEDETPLKLAINQLFDEHLMSI